MVLALRRRFDLGQGGSARRTLAMISSAVLCQTTSRDQILIGAENTVHANATALTTASRRGVQKAFLVVVGPQRSA